MRTRAVLKGRNFVGFERVPFMHADNFTGVDTGCVILCFTALRHPSLTRVHDYNACHPFVKHPSPSPVWGGMLCSLLTMPLADPGGRAV